MSCNPENASILQRWNWEGSNLKKWNCLKKIVILDQELHVNVAICNLVWSWCQDITVTCSIIFEDCLRPETTDRLAAPCRFAGCMCGGCAKCAREVTAARFSSCMSDVSVGCRFDTTDLMRFTLTVRKNYRNVPYHNWVHAFSVAHSMYTVVKTCQHQLTHLEVRVSLVHHSHHYRSASWL